MRRSVITGCGGYLPERILTNNEIARMVDTSDEWIVSRTGIRERHVAAEGELTSDLAVAAARAALGNTGVEAAAVDLIVVATSTPDETFPATATVVQSALGITRGAAFDVQAVCSGFIYGLAVVDNFIKVGQADTVLLIGAETFSRILDWNDRSTCVLFGDGAGAVVLRRVRGLTATVVFSPRACMPMAASMTRSMSTAGRPPHKPPVTCEWRERTCSAMRSPTSRT
jgi:3-oxoacyl-[acyl-carrier-protein] synthase-3